VTERFGVARMQLERSLRRSAELANLRGLDRVFRA
jgi:hypothetical protein